MKKKRFNSYATTHIFNLSRLFKNIKSRSDVRNTLPDIIDDEEN